MCRQCLFEDLGMGMGRRGRGYGYGGDMFGDGFGGDGINRDGFASVSQRAKNALESAKSTFLHHLATVDVSKGEVTTEIIQFHLVPDMRKAFNRYVKEYGCTGNSRQITRAEQDLINKTRKSLLWFTSVKVTPEAQRAYFDKNPHLRRPAVASTSTSSSAMTSGSATSAGTSCNNSISSGSSAQSSASASSSSSASASLSNNLKGPLQDVSEQKLRRQLNEAAVKHAASNPTHKKLALDRV